MKYNEFMDSEGFENHSSLPGVSAEWARMNVEIKEFYPDKALLSQVENEMRQLEQEGLLPNELVELGAGAGAVICRTFLRAKGDDVPVHLTLVDTAYKPELKEAHDIRRLALQQILSTLEEGKGKSDSSQRTGHFLSRIQQMVPKTNSGMEKALSAKLFQYGVSVTFLAADINRERINFPSSEFVLGGHKVINYFDADVLQSLIKDTPPKIITLVDTNKAGADIHAHPHSLGIEGWESKLTGESFKLRASLSSEHSSAKTKAILLTQNLD